MDKSTHTLALNDAHKNISKHIVLKTTLSIVTVLLLLFSFNNELKAQSGLCDPTVPFAVVDLSASDTATWLSANIARVDLCCGAANPDNCLEFEITIHPDAIAVNFEVASGAMPPGALFYQINCGPPVAIGTPVCLSGVGPHTLTFCKPGNNANTYAVTSIPEPSVSDPNWATENCPTEIEIIGMEDGSITINDISGGGANLAYLSCTTCNNPTVTPSGAFPTYADYEICGTPLGSVCLASATYCDTVRVYFYDSIIVAVNPNPANFCASDAGVWLYSSISGGVAPYTYEWYDQVGGVGNVLSTNADYFATAAGNYSVVVYDSLYPECGPYFTNVTVSVDAVVDATITPIGPFCETDAAVALTAVTPGGIWSGTGVVGNIILGIVFDPTTAGPGDHLIQYTVVNGACSDTDTEIIHVDAVVDATITPIGPFCEIDAAVALTAVSPGGVWSGTGVVGNTFDPTVALAGDHLIQYDIVNGECSDSDTETIHVDSEVIATITPVGPFCETDAAVALTAVTPGGVWSGTGVVGNTFDPTVALAGDHLIQYDVVNGACADSDTETIHVDSEVIATITPIGPFCETDAAVALTAVTPGGIWSGTGVVGNTFDPTVALAGDHLIQYDVVNGACADSDTETIHVDSEVFATITPIGPFCETDAAVALTAVTPGGVWSGTGVVGNTFDPTVALAGDHLIQYDVVNGACADSDTETIHVDSEVIATITPIGPFCETDAAVALTAVTPGGVWSGTGVVGNTFDPTVALAGDHLIQYDVVNGACADSDTETIHVDSEVIATITPIGPFCETDAAVALTAVTPGGVWSGTGVVGNTFDPTVALAGDHLIQYDVVNGACADSDTETIHVDSEVIATITPIGPFCEIDAAVALTAVTPGGVWSGTGVVGNTFDPTVALAGDHLIQYDVVNGACADSDTETIHVDSEVIATITPIGPFCEIDAAVALTAVTPGGGWSGTGVVGNTFDPTVALAGDHLIQYDVVNGACADSDTETIHVDSEVIATITPIGPFCEIDAAVALTAVTPGGVWSGTGVVGNTFDPTVALAGDHLIQYDVVNGACADSDTETIHVDSEVIATITPIGPFCETDAAVALTAVTPGGIWSGTGVVGNTFDPTVALAGDHLIQYDVVNGACSDSDTETIHVDSEVFATITPIGPFCETDAAVALTAVTPGGIWSGTGVVGNTFDPTVALAGDHLIQYDVVNGACADSDTETIHVDSEVIATITPIGPFCETDAAVALTAVTPGGVWSGTGVVGNTFDPTVALAGDHLIQYDVVNGACADSDTETIHVDSEVIATITPIGPFCETDAAVALTAVTPGGVWSGTGVVGNTFDPTVALAGDHLIQYDVVNGACSDSDTETIHVDSEVIATITPIGPFCEIDAAIALTAVTPGGIWSGTGVVGNTFDPTVALAGDHLIQYDVVNGACADSDTETIHVDSEVIATITPIGPFCETDAAVALTAVTPGGVWSGTGVVGNTFDPTVALAGDHLIQYDVVNGACADSDTETIHVDSEVIATITPIGPFCETDAAVALTAVTPGGVWSGTGVVGNTFDPTVALAGDHLIQYDVVNGACADSDTETIHVDSEVFATITPIGPFCETDAAVALTAVTPGGVWLGTGVVGNTFDPTVALAGDHLIQYDVVNGACSDSDTETIHVDSEVIATITPIGPFCEIDAAVALTAVTPGGVWSGTGVVGNTFDPTVALAGDHLIQYDVVNGACADSDTETIHVDSEVIATITPIGPFCETDAAVALTAVTPGGVWSGTGVVGNNFFPLNAGAGDHLIQYDVVNGACADSDTETIHVDSEVIATITSIGPFCETDAAVALTAVTPGGVWSGTGVIGNNFDPTIALAGDHLIQYDVINGMCTDSDTETIHVDSEVIATITPIGPFCETDATVVLTAVTPGGVWSGAGVVGNNFDPNIAQEGDHLIQYNITNGACSDSDTETIHVDSEVFATITPAGPFCETDVIIALTATTPGGTWSGTGVVGNTFDPTVALAGDHIIQYDVVNGACSDSDTETIHVDAIVDATITPIGPFCETDAAVALTAVTPGGVWSGTGVVGNNFDPTIALAGDYLIQYDVVNGMCADSDTETIHVDSEVIATITPIGPFCETDAAVALTAVTPGGVWSGTGVVGNNFDPTIALAGDHLIQYDVVNGACADSDTETIHVDAIVDASITPIGPFCETDAAVALTAVTPGGVWSGTGIVGNTFDPTIALAGDHLIQYDVINGACADSDTETIHVDAIVDATITPIGPFCQDEAAVPLSSVTPGGIWSGTGVVGNTFDPNIAGIGDHIIQYNVTNGMCSDSDTETIHVDQIISATITPVGPFCETDAAVALTSVTPGGTWSGTGIVGNNFDPNIAGSGQHLITYQVTVGSCSGSDTEIIIVDGIVDASITPTGPFCETDAAVALIAATPGGVWSGTGVIVNNFDPGTAGIGDHNISYSVTNGSCSDNDNTTIHVDTYLDATITPIAAVCENAGIINLTAANPGGVWSGSFVAGNTFDPLAAGQGDHIVNYTIASGSCSSNDQITIHVDSIPDATITPAGPFCQDFDFAYLNAVSDGGTWSGTGITNPATGQFSPLFSGPGDHLVTYNIINGECNDSDSFSIHVDEILDATINPIIAVCQSGGLINLSAVNPGGTWAGQGIIDPINGILDPSLVEHGDNSMTYTIINGECESTDLHIYQIDAEVDATITSNPGTICISDAPFNLSSVQSGGIWAGIGIGNIHSGTFMPSIAGAGTHEITYNIENGTCEDADTIYITIDAIPDATITAAGPFCETDASIVLNAATLGGTWSGTGVVGNNFDPSIAGAGDHIITYNITIGTCSNSDVETIHVDASVIATITPIGPFCETATATTLSAVTPDGLWSGTGVVGNTFDPPTAGQGNHTITYNITNGVCSDSDNIIITVDDYIDINITPVDPLCENDPSFTIISSINGGTWSGTGIIDPIHGIFDPQVSGTGTFTINYTFNNGTCISNASTDITVNPNPTAIITNLSSEYCEGDEYIVVITTPPGGVLSGPGVFMSVFDPEIAGAGTHTIDYLTTNVYGCSDQTSAIVTVHSSPAVNISLPTDEFCFDGELVTLTGIPGGGTFSGPGVSGDKFIPPLAGSGEHELTYIYIDGMGCQGIATTNVTVSDAIILETSGQSLVCFGAHSGNISVIASGGVPPFTYIWDDPASSTTAVVNGLDPGTYTVTVTDDWGCDEISSLTISSPTELIVSITSSTNPDCYGSTNGSIYSNVSGGTPPYSYIWNDATSSTSTSLINIEAGTYNVTITDNVGCSGSIGATITAPDELIATISSSTNATCNGGNDGSASVSVIGGTEPYSYLWNNPAQTPLANANHLPAGTYTVIVTDANGCTTETSVDINDSSSITANITSTDVVCTQHLGTAIITVNGGLAPYDYAWSTGSLTNSTIDLTTGTHYVTITDSQNCQYIGNVVINMVGNIHANIIEQQGVLCYGSNEAILQAHSVNGMNPVSYMWSNSVINEFNNNLTAGHYTVTAIDSWGCTGTDDHYIDNPSEIVITPTITSAGCFGDATGSISIQISGGNNPYFINWSTGATTATINNINPGSYTVTVTDANNCLSIATYTVNSPSNPLNINIISHDVNCFEGSDGSIAISVTGGTPGYTYNWEFNNNHFNGSTANSLSPGQYNLTIADSQGCVMDTSVIIGEPESMEYSFIFIDPSCIGNDDGYIEIVVIGGTPPYILAWSDQTSQIPYIAGLMQGTYSFTITDNGGCTIATEIIELIDTEVDCIAIPNAFTPNNDGINDTWIIENIGIFPGSYITIYNRWGQLVFQGYGNSEPWDGRWNNEIVPTGSYVYTVDLYNGTKYCGIVTIVK